jgi:hypothetical protein
MLNNVESVIMMGFVNLKREPRGLGGDAFWAKQRRNRIIFGIFGVLGFMLLNIVLYMLSSF